MYKQIKLSSWYYSGEWLNYFKLKRPMCFEGRNYWRGFYHINDVEHKFIEYLRHLDPQGERYWYECNERDGEMLIYA